MHPVQKIVIVTNASYIDQYYLKTQIKQKSVLQKQTRVDLITAELELNLKN